MPTYLYRTEGGELVEMVYPIGKAPKKTKTPYGPAKRDIAAEVASQPRHAGGPGWPITCCASGVHASQADELRAHFKKHGLSVEVTDDGDPVYENPRQRKAALKCRGMVDLAE